MADTPLRFGASARIAVSAAFLVLLAIAIAPTLMVDIPAMADYPNHLARMFILAADGTPQANPYYHAAWALYPNLAMDLAVPQMARWLSVETATRCFFLAGQILVVTGAVAIEWAVKGRHQVAGFAALLVLHGLPFSFGFVNFEFGLGLALWGIAQWLVLRERAWGLRLAAHAVCVALLFVGHFFALGIYGLAVGAYEAWRLWAARWRFAGAASVVALLAGPILPLLALMAASGGSIGGRQTEWEILAKIHWILLATNGYSTVLSAVSVVGMLLVLYVLHKQRWVSLHPAGRWIGGAFFLMFLLMPFRLLDTAFTDARLVVAAALVVPGFMTLSLPNRRIAAALVAFVGSVIVANVAVVATVWLGYRADYAEFKASFGQLPKGALVLVGHSGEAPDPPRDLAEYPAYHAPTLAVHFAHALVPTLFTYPGKQPVEVVPAFRRLDVPQGGPVPISVLQALAQGREAGEVPNYVRHWDRDFAYLYLLGPHIANPMPDILDEVAIGHRFQLYRIKRR